MSKTISVTGPDNLPHSLHCQFITYSLPCSCDATRFAPGSKWFESYMRWMRISTIVAKLKWPIEGPDHTPWIPGFDFNDDYDASIPEPPC